MSKEDNIQEERWWGKVHYDLIFLLLKSHSDPLLIHCKSDPSGLLVLII